MKKSRNRGCSQRRKRGQSALGHLFHAMSRASQRFDARLGIDDVLAISKIVRTGQAAKIKKLSNKKSVQKIRVYTTSGGEKMENFAVIYDHGRKMVATILPRNARELRQETQVQESRP